MAKSHGCIPEFFPSFRKASPFPSFLCGLRKINAKKVCRRGIHDGAAWLWRFRHGRFKRIEGHHLAVRALPYPRHLAELGLAAFSNIGKASLAYLNHCWFVSKRNQRTGIYCGFPIHLDTTLLNGSAGVGGARN